MHIGLIIYGSLDELSGGFLYDRQMKRGFEAQGHSVSLLAIPWRRYGRGLLDNFDRALLVRIGELEADILLQDELCHPSLFLLNRSVSRLFSRPLYAIVHHLRAVEQHPAPLAALNRWVERHYLATLDGFIFNSQATRRSVESLLGRSTSGVVAYPGADHLAPGTEGQAVSADAREPRELRILHAGSLIRRKGLDLLLSALGQLPPERWRLDIAGRADLDPRYAAAIGSRLAEEPFQSRARYHGTVAAADLDRLYRQADLLAVPSRHEGFGMVYLEAMGYGLPVLASAAGGAPELVEAGRQGTLVEPGNVSQIRRALQAYLDQPERLRAQSAAARRRYQQHPSWHQSAQTALRYLEADLAERAVSPQPAHLDPNQRRRSTT